MKKIIALIIIIVVICIVISIEHFTINDGNALNNLIDQINNQEVKVSNMTSSDKVEGNTIEGKVIGDNMKKAIMDLMFPVNSFFMYDYKIDLVDGKPSSITNTPLDYGKWERCSYDEVGVIGIKSNSNGKEGGRMGDKNLKIWHVPPHSHQLWHGQWYDSSDGGTGEESISRWGKYNSHKVEVYKINGDENDTYHRYMVDDNVVTKNIILNTGVTQNGYIKIMDRHGNRTNYDNGTKMEIGQPINTTKADNFDPWGYYLYLYRKTEL